MRHIFLDCQSTTPCDPRVVEAMTPFFTERFGNPHSRNHHYGWEAENAVEQARAQIAELISADPSEIIFTSGATESNNLALKGVMEFYKNSKNHLITTMIEHKCVLDSCRHLEQNGFRVTYLPVCSKGFVDLQQLKDSITDQTAMVSIMMANNEIGVIQDMASISEICRDRGVFLHTDAAQSFGKVPINMQELSIDLMSISSHKNYGPKGVGALYVSKAKSKNKPRVRLMPLITGGGQERGMRSGTLPTPLCVGFGEAARISLEVMPTESARVRALTQKLKDGILSQLPDVWLNGDWERRLPGNLNLSFAYIEGEGFMMAAKELCVSSGSACTSASLEPSYVLRALGLSDDLAHSSIRFGLGRFNTEEEIDFAIQTIVSSVHRLREMSPLLEMVQKGIDLSKVEWVGDHH